MRAHLKHAVFLLACLAAGLGTSALRRGDPTIGWVLVGAAALVLGPMLYLEGTHEHPERWRLLMKWAGFLGLIAGLVLVRADRPALGWPLAGLALLVGGIALAPEVRRDFEVYERERDGHD